MPHLSPWLRSVYLLGDGLLFDDIIVHMFASNSNLRVIRRVYVDESAFLADVNWHHPDVILLNETGQLNCKRMLALLATISLATDL